MVEAEENEASVREEFQALADQLAEVGRAAGEQSRDRVEPFIEQAKADLDSARQALDHAASVTGDAVRQSTRGAAADLRDLRRDLATVRADLRVQLVADSTDKFRSAAHEVVDAWRARLDELTVQADLARMETRDEVQADMKMAEHQWAELRVWVERLGDQASEATTDLRADLDRLADDLRETLRQVTERLRRDRHEHLDEPPG